MGIQLAGPCRGTEIIGGDHRLIEVKAIQIEGHGRDPQRCKPDADHRPDSQEEVQRSAITEGCVLEEQSTEVAVSSHIDGLVGRNRSVPRRRNPFLECAHFRG